MFIDFCLWSVFSTFFAMQVQPAEKCTTPSGVEGECIPLHTCPPLMNAFTNPIRGTEEVLRKFKCRTTRLTPYVCCETSWKSDVYAQTLSDRRFCGYQHSDDYVSKRNGTAIDEFPWLAAIVTIDLISKQKEIACQGVLINNRYVLTSIQCFRGPDDSNSITTFVRLGEFNIKTETDCVRISQSEGDDCSITEDFGIEEKILHPLYHYGNGLNDIALLRLNRSASYTDFIRPICLPTPGTAFAEPGETLYVTGWGETTSGGVYPEVKKKISTVLITNDECQGIVREDRFLITAYHMCTIDFKNNTEFTCGRDAGAPAMISRRNQWHIEGISSKGFPCGLGLPEIKTRVSAYLEWIRQNMRPYS